MTPKRHRAPCAPFRLITVVRLVCQAYQRCSGIGAGAHPRPLAPAVRGALVPRSHWYKVTECTPEQHRTLQPAPRGRHCRVVAQDQGSREAFAPWRRRTPIPETVTRESSLRAGRMRSHREAGCVRAFSRAIQRKPPRRRGPAPASVGRLAAPAPLSDGVHMNTAWGEAPGRAGGVW